MLSPPFIMECCPLFNRNKSCLPICVPVKVCFFHDVNETTLRAFFFFVVLLVRPLLKRGGFSVKTSCGAQKESMVEHENNRMTFI